MILKFTYFPYYLLFMGTIWLINKYQLKAATILFPVSNNGSYGVN